MLRNKNIVQQGVKTRFSSTRQPANAGRKPALYTVAKKVYNIGWPEFRDVVLYLMQLTKSEIEEVMERDDTPIWVINVARAMHKDTGKGVTFTLRELLDRVFGKVGTEGKGGTGVEIDLSRLTGKEVQAYYALLSKAAGKAEE